MKTKFSSPNPKRLWTQIFVQPDHVVRLAKVILKGRLNCKPQTLIKLNGPAVPFRGLDGEKPAARVSGSFKSSLHEKGPSSLTSVLWIDGKMDTNSNVVPPRIAEAGKANDLILVGDNKDSTFGSFQIFAKTLARFIWGNQQIQLKKGSLFQWKARLPDFQHAGAFRNSASELQTKWTSVAFCLVGLSLPSLSLAGPSRISSRLVDLGEVHKIYLAQGLASVIQLPYPVTEAKVGNPDAVAVQISKTLPSELTLTLRRAGVPATNLIVRCGTRSFVFDLIPSRKTHQDLVRISGSYGAPGMEDLGAVLIDSSSPPKSKEHGPAINSDMVLIDSSNQKGQAGKEVEK